MANLFKPLSKVQSYHLTIKNLINISSFFSKNDFFMTKALKAPSTKFLSEVGP